MAVPLAISLPLKRNGRIFPVPPTPVERRRAQIRSVILASFGERVMRPTYGASLGDVLFENMTSATIRLAQSRTLVALSAHVPTISVYSVTISEDREAGLFTIEVLYKDLILDADDSYTLKVG